MIELNVFFVYGILDVLLLGILDIGILVTQCINLPYVISYLFYNIRLFKNFSTTYII